MKCDFLVTPWKARLSERAVKGSLEVLGCLKMVEYRLKEQGIRHGIDLFNSSHTRRLS